MFQASIDASWCRTVYSGRKENDMFVLRKYTKIKQEYGIVTSRKEYTILFLFGIIPLFIQING